MRQCWTRCGLERRKEFRSVSEYQINDWLMTILLVQRPPQHQYCTLNHTDEPNHLTLLSTL
jgi:hypothetical protein